MKFLDEISLLIQTDFTSTARLYLSILEEVLNYLRNTLGQY